ncbi:CBS domain containing protein [Deferribacter desulfuricans SSM1]|uniref:CBS domain containing protein n=1 Tax=Deferribacter desulfuricans (strain DSM 14783 / JCM 11476 / NBRC 101012 / SSM1) TaxID=639282 RepID=D3PEC7_DEFDS|nr:CBS domain-containing protein [Deferribacter desulfuricans]BAI80950.1 CBS domain containing protein [Deferribacter desulfuricans SSM1]
MFVKDWMKKDIVVVNKNDTILDALHLMREHGFRRLPVLEGDRLVGIITEKDIKDFSPSKATTLDIYELHNILAKYEVKDAMTKDVITVSPDDPIEKAAILLRDKRFGGLPVVDGEGNLVGLITAVDVFDVFVEAMGIREKGVRVNILVEDRPGAIAVLAKIIKQFDLNIISLATFYIKDKPHLRDLVIRINGDNDNIDKCIEEIKKNGFDITSVLRMDEI